MTIIDLPPGVQDFLARCPKTGGGVHDWIFDAAMMLHRAKVPPDTMPGLLRESARNCGRPVADGEIHDAIVNSARILKQGFSAEPRTPKWPQPNKENIQAIARGGVNLDVLKEMSPVKWHDGKPHPEEVIDLLFPGNPLLCVGISKFKVSTKPRDKWRGRLFRNQFIVPSPMSKEIGITRQGKPSPRALDNTGPRRFLIVEFDNGTFDQHAALLLHLAKYAPFVLAVHSGGKSLHGWFFIKGQPDVKVEKFFRYTVSLGADDATWSKCQLVRVPDGWRYEKNKRQPVIYFNPSLIKDYDKN